MLKKFLKAFHLPTHVGLSFCLFCSSVIFALCFGNPSWDYAQPDGTLSNYANMGASSSFAFIFGLWFVFDCFCYFEKNIKEKTRNILLLISDLGLVMSIFVIYVIFAALCPDFVVGWIHFLSFFLVEGLCSFSIYLRYKERGEKPRKAELYIAGGFNVAALIFSIIFWIISSYRSIILFLLLLLAEGAFIGLEFFFRKSRKTNKVLEEKGGEEKGLFIIFSSASISVAFMPIWVYSFKGNGEGYSSIWLIISLIYLLSSLILMIASFIGELVAKRSMRNTLRTVISTIMMFIGGLGIALTSIFFASGTSYPLEACYYMVAVGVGFLLFGLFGFLYGEIRRANHEPRSE